MEAIRVSGRAETGRGNVGEQMTREKREQMERELEFAVARQHDYAVRVERLRKLLDDEDPDEN